MKTPSISTTAIVICVLSFCLLPAKANLVPIAITAEVTGVWENFDSLEGRINVGDLITGVYVYDSSVLDSYSADGTMGRYEHYTSPAGVTLTVGGFVFITDPDNVEFIIDIINDPTVVGGGGDRYEFQSRNNLPLPNAFSVDRISLSLWDSSGNALSSDVLPTMAPVLDDWDAGELTISGGGRTFIVHGLLTSAVLVPEPATFVFLGLGGLALLRNRRYIKSKCKA